LGPSGTQGGSRDRSPVLGKKEGGVLPQLGISVQAQKRESGIRSSWYSALQRRDLKQRLPDRKVGRGKLGGGRRIHPPRGVQFGECVKRTFRETC